MPETHRLVLTVRLLSVCSFSLMSCVTGPLDRTDISDSTQTFSGVTPYASAWVIPYAQNRITGEFAPLALGVPGTTAATTDCAKNNSAPWYSFSVDAPLPSATSMQYPWEFYNSSSPGKNSLVMKVKAVDLYGNQTEFANFDQAGVTCGQRYTCSDEIINNCSTKRPLTLFTPCGAAGQHCCVAAGNNTCSEAGTVCDWDLVCRKNTWPPASKYRTFNNPGDCITEDWTSEIQGLASDGKFWFVTQGDQNAGLAPRMWKVPLNVTWNFLFGPVLGSGRPPVPVVRPGYPMTSAHVSGGHKCGHWGDVDYYNGKLYVPMEQCNDGKRWLVRYDTDLNPVDEFRLDWGPPGATLNEGAAALVAVHPKTGEIYTIDGEPHNSMHVYRIVGSKLVWNRDVYLHDEQGQLFEVNTPQGAAFSPDGSKLYVIGQNDSTRPLFAFQVNPGTLSLKYRLRADVDLGHTPPQETEGLAVLDTSAAGLSGMGEIHTFIYEDEAGAADPLFECAGGVWFKHITLDGDKRL